MRHYAQHLRREEKDIRPRQHLVCHASGFTETKALVTDETDSVEELDIDISHNVPAVYFRTTGE